MRTPIWVLFFSCWLAGIGAAAGGDDGVVTLDLRDGSRLVGRVVAEDEASVRIETSGGLEVTVPRSSIVSRREGGESDHAGVGVDPNYSRLLFAPTGRALKKGDGYFADYELLFPGVAYGLTDNISLSGGFSVIPGLGLGEQLFHISPKIGFDVGERGSVAVGGLIARAGGDGDFDDDGESVSVGFAVGTFGSRAHSLTVGVGLGDTSSEFSDAVPILMFGGTTTLSRHVALVGETWMFLNEDFQLADQPFGAGVRFFSDRLSADVGVILSGELIEEGFPIPWLSVTYHFGRHR